jgi:LytS/YehU family sensor histidine kinase
VRFRATADAATRDLPVPHLSVFPLVESAVLCAAGSEAPLQVEVSASAEEDWLRVEVRDGGAMALGERRAHAGWEPVELLRSRLDQLGGGHRLEMEDAPGGGVVARLAVPLAREAA